MAFHESGRLKSHEQAQIIQRLQDAAAAASFSSIAVRKVSPAVRKVPPALRKVPPADVSPRTRTLKYAALCRLIRFPLDRKLHGALNIPTSKTLTFLVVSEPSLFEHGDLTQKGTVRKEKTCSQCDCCRTEHSSSIRAMLGHWGQQLWMHTPHVHL